MTRIAVTGATGQVGGRVARALAAAGVDQRLVVRDPDRAPRLPGASVAVAAYRDGEAVLQALDGIDTVFMVSGSESVDRVAEHFSVVDAAARAGVRQLVYLSFVGASPDATFTLVRDHFATEEHIREMGLAATILRDNLYADFLPGMAGDDGVLRGPAGEGRVAAVAQNDVADAVVAVLGDPGEHAGRTYELTGPAALSLDEVAATITSVTGRPVRYESETVQQAFTSRAACRAPDWQVRAWVSTYTAIAAGELAAVTDDVDRLTGHPATSLAQLLRTFRHPAATAPRPGYRRARCQVCAASNPPGSPSGSRRTGSCAGNWRRGPPTAGPNAGRARLPGPWGDAWARFDDMAGRARLVVARPGPDAARLVRALVPDVVTPDRMSLVRGALTLLPPALQPTGGDDWDWFWTTRAPTCRPSLDVGPLDMAHRATVCAVAEMLARHSPRASRDPCRARRTGGRSGTRTGRWPLSLPPSRCPARCIWPRSRPGPTYAVVDWPPR